MKIGIMGGTFDPIHNGHLIISEYIRDYLDLDEIIFIPAGQPPHKDKKGVLSPFHRYKMTKLAIEDNPKFSISDIEIKKNKTSYTYDTILNLKEEYEDAELYFIIGADSLFSLEEWYKFKELSRIIKFALWERTGYYRDDIIDRIELLKDKYTAQIKYVEGPIIEISSSQIRNRVSLKKSIKYLVHEEVKKYIEKNNIYIGEDDESL